MRKYFLLAWSNIRKAKGQSFILALILAIATVMLQAGLILTFDYSKNFDRRAELVNSEDVVFSYQTRDPELIRFWNETLLGDERTQQIEQEEVLCHTLSFRYGKAEVNTHAVIMPIDVPRDLGQFRFIEKAESESPDTVYLPYVYRTGGDYRIGDTLRLNIKAREFNYVVGGFYENTLIGSFNGGISSFLLARDAYEQMDRETDIQGVMLSVKLKDRADGADYYSEMENRLSARAGNLVHNAVHYELAKSARTLTANICSLIFLGLALMIAAVSLVVTAFRISNNIEEDMKSYGTLQAVGYRSRQIIGAILLQMMLIGFVGVFAGIALTYAVLPALNWVLMIQTGLIWQYGFQIVPLLLVLVVLLGTVAITALLATRKLRKLHPIVALRQGIVTHSFRRNPFPLSSARGNITALLAAKTVCRNLKQNIAVFLIACLLSFLCVFMSVMMESFCLNPQVMMGFFAGESTDASVYTSAEDSDEIFEALQSRPEVERAYRYQIVMTLVKGKQLATYVADGKEHLNDPSMCYEGRFPEFDNEIALGGLFAKQQSIRIGDVVWVENEGSKEDYLVTGFIQCSNNLGQDAFLLTSGMERIISSPMKGSFYVFLKDGYDIGQFLEEIGKDYGNKIVVSINFKAVIDGSLGTYQSIVSVLIIIFAAIALLIIGLVLYLMVKTMLIRKKRDYGIQKAIGYTTAQLILQTALSFLPSIMLATAVGFGAGIALINPVLTVLFSGIGIMKATFPIPAGLTAGFALVFLLFSFGITALVSLRVRRITAKALLVNE